MIKFLLVFLLAGVNVAFAQLVPATNTIPTALHALTAVGNVQTVQPVLNDLGNFTKMSYQTGALGDVFTRSKSLVPVAGHDPLVIDVVAKIPKTSVMAAFGKFAVKGMPLINTASAIYELASDLGFGVTNTEGTAPIFTKVNPGASCQSDCWQYWAGSISGAPASGWSNYLTPAAACTKAAANYVNPPYTAVFASATATVCTASILNGSGAYVTSSTSQIQKQSTPPYNFSTTSVASVQEVTAGIDARPSWAESNPLARMIVESIKAGDSLLPGEVVVTGPASSPATTTTTVNNTDNTTTTTTNQNQYTYAGDTITTNNVTNNTTVNNSTGAVVNSTTSSSSVINTSTPAEKPSVDSASDTPLGPVPTLYTPKFPDALGGVWSTRKAEITASPLFSVMGAMFPSGFTSGTCPVWMLPLDMGPWNYGSYDVAPPCWVWAVGKALVIIGALLLARALVFGG